MIWEEGRFCKKTIAELSQQLEVSDLLATLLVKINICDPEAARAFLSPRLTDLTDPFCLDHMDRAVCRLSAAIKNNDSIVIQGDYDVDGVTSTALLVSILREFRASVRYFVPRRQEEAYGLSRASIDRILQRGKPALFIALDCGTNAAEEVAYLASLGIDVMIVDHHQAKRTIPQDCILLNPHLNNASHPWEDLSTVGLVFKWMHGFLKRLRKQSHPKALAIRLSDYLDLVALGTVADMVPLRGENRILTHWGLLKLQNRCRQGIKALCQTSGIHQDHTISSSDISFRIGPRINASGRLSDASLSIGMLLSEDPLFCEQAAERLNQLNQERKTLERHVTKAALEQAQEQKANASIVVYDQAWHTGIIGIIAGKLCHQFHRPTIVLGQERGRLKGSGRSISEINLMEVLSSCASLLEEWGGHPMAIGLTLKTEHFVAFRQAFDIAVTTLLPAQSVKPTLSISRWLPTEILSKGLLAEIDRMRPFGQANPEPLFGLRRIQFFSPPISFGERHFRFQISGAKDRLVSGVAWNKANRLPPAHTPIDLVVKINGNQWNGRKSMQLELIDWRLSQ